jgi:serine/threonine protein kinase
MPRLENAESFAKASLETILQKTKEVVTKEMENCEIIGAFVDEATPKFALSELVVGRVVGRGGFCAVRQLQAIRLDGAQKREASRWNPRGILRTSDSSLNVRSEAEPVIDVPARERLARMVWYKKGGKYVVKHVEPELLRSDKVRYLKGNIDIALEAKFLAAMSHPHILELRGVCSAAPYEVSGFFIILDELPEIMSKRLNTWMQLDRSTKGITGFMTRGRRKAPRLLTERLLVAHDVAGALDYLHCRNIIFRDLVRMTRLYLRVKYRSGSSSTDTKGLLVCTQ